MCRLQPSWIDPPANLPLCPDEVHVWRAHPQPAKQQLDQMFHCLSADEQARAYRFRFARDRQRFVASRTLLRTILARYLDAAPQELCFTYGPHGKPELASVFRTANLRFNLAHSGDLAVLAVCHQRQIGIDLERIRPIPEVDTIAQIFFSSEELAQLISSQPPHKEELFFRFWTRKEAFSKATGQGIAQLDRQNPSSSLAGSPFAPCHQWSTLEFNPAEGFIATLVIQGSDNQPCWLRCNLDSLSGNVRDSPIQQTC